MLQPKKVKHRKWHRGRVSGRATRKLSLAFGTFGLKAIEGRWVTARQIEAARRAITRHIQRGGKVWIRIFPDKPITIKGNEVRMGGGKGAVDHYVAVVKPGVVMFEMDGVARAVAREALRLASHKLPVSTRIIERTG